jgi:hypothetical protein
MILVSSPFVDAGERLEIHVAQVFGDWRRDSAHDQGTRIDVQPRKRGKVIVDGVRYPIEREIFRKILIALIYNSLQFRFTLQRRSPFGFLFTLPCLFAPSLFKATPF